MFFSLLWSGFAPLAIGSVCGTSQDAQHRVLVRRRELCHLHDLIRAQPPGRPRVRQLDLHDEEADRVACGAHRDLVHLRPRPLLPHRNTKSCSAMFFYPSVFCCSKQPRQLHAVLIV